MNVTEDLLRRYIEEFNNTFLETARAFLPKESLELLLRYPLIQGNIIGYVSTQFGAGFEYLGQGSPRITIRRSSARIEDLFTRVPSRARRLRSDQVIEIAEGDFTIARSVINGPFPFRLASENSSIRLSSVSLVGQGGIRYVVHAELYGNRTAEFWSEANAVRRAKDEILLAILDLKQAKKRSLSIAEYLREFKEKTVLVLGDFSAEGRKRLEAIKDAIADLGYVPILLDEIPDDLHYNLEQRAVAIGSVARFVVFDDSSKSGHLVELVRSKINDWVTLILRLEGSKGSFMTRGASSYSKVIRESTYSFANLSETLSESVQWVETTITELQLAGMRTYPWRTEL